MAIFGQEQSQKAGISIDKYYDWKGAQDAGVLSAWDKEAGENVTLDTAEFIVLSDTYAIKGWSEKAGARIYSNEISSFQNEDFKVRCGDQTLIEGKYADIKSKIGEMGAKLHVVVTALMADGTTAKISLKGAAFMEFSDAKRAISTNTNEVSLVGFKDEKKGAIKYRTPKFEQGVEITPERMEQAIEFAKELAPKAKPASGGDKIDASDLPW